MKQTIGILLFAILISNTLAALPAKTFHTILNKAENPVKNQLAILPNFKTGRVNVSFKSQKKLSGKIVVFNQNGSVVLTQQANIHTGKNIITINNFISLDEGAYNVYVKAGKKTYNASYLLWK